jgi:prepilin signal peptidase PulO-like enzyme (type II secretory pathway)
MPVQRVRRVIRKIDPWTVLKVSIVFNAIMALVTVLGLVVFWSVFVNAGIPDRINDLALTIGLENGITFDGAVYFRIAVLLAIVGTILMTGLFTLGAVVYNLISDLVGGVEFVVLEETGAAVPASRRVKLPVTVAPVEGGKGRGVRSLPKVAPLVPSAPPVDGEPTRVPEPTVATRRTGEATRQTGT